MNYTELKAQQSKKMNDFKGIFFAFSNDQFAEGMKSLGLEPDQTDKIYKMSTCGGFILKTRNKAFKQMLDDIDQALKDFLATREGLKEALIYELANHEFCITYEYEQTLDSLGLDYKTIDKDVLREAKEEYLEGCNW